jgi:hypothetical protein
LLRALLVATACFAGGNPAARAEDGRAAARYFDEEFEKVGSECATRVFALVTEARRESLNAFAVEEAYRLLLVFDRDHEEAREYLGFVKKAGGWSRDEQKAELVDRQNRKLHDEAPTAFGRRVTAWLEARAETNRAVAAKLVDLGKACAEKGYESQSRRAYERALGVDAGCTEAHVALGHVRVEDLWLSPDEKKAFEQSAAGMPVAEKTPLEEKLGDSLEKSQSRHFRFQTDTDVVDLAAAARIAEATYTCFLADFGINPREDPFAGKRARLSVVSTPEAWQTWINLFARERDREAAKGALSYCDPEALVAGAFRSDPSDAPDPLDPLLSGAARLMAERVWHLERHSWLDTGLTLYYAMKVRGVTRTFGLSPDPEMSAACSSENWRPYVYELVRRHEDEDLTKIAAMDGPLDVPSAVKSWAVVTWLMDTDRAKFVEFLRSAAGSDAKLDAVVLRVFGKNLFGIDRAWRAYALLNY